MKELDQKQAPGVGGGALTNPIYPEPVIVPTYPLPPNPYPSPDPILDPTGSHPKL
jgi:hypothetical protein